MRENNITKIIFTGDIFDNSGEDNWSFKKYRLNKRFLENFKGDDIQIYSNMGNHDMFHGLEETDGTIFGEMVNENIINYITENNIIQNTPIGNIIIKGIDYNNDNQYVLNQIDKFSKENTGSEKVLKIAILHSNIMSEENQFTDFSYNQLSKYNIDIIICGHYHLGFPTKKLNNTIFVNNWNLTRVVRDYHNKLDKHTPEFEDISISIENNDFNIDTKTVQIPCGKYKDTFVPKAIDLLTRSTSDISAFFGSIDISDLKKDVSENEIIDRIMFDGDFEDKHLTLAMSYLNK
jgi:DNA repair exonuclease SbcCD nuclease subunit